MWPFASRSSRIIWLSLFDDMLTPSSKQPCQAARSSCARLLDHLIRPRQQGGRDRQAEGLGGFEVDDEFELCWLLDGKIGGLGPLQDLVHIASGAAEQIGQAWPVRHKSTILHGLSVRIARRQAVLGRELGYGATVGEIRRGRCRENCVGALSGDGGESWREIGGLGCGVRRGEGKCLGRG